jgi:ribosomal RNA-processing protein 36
LSKVSFGALAKAQDAISRQSSAGRKRKRGEDTSAPQEDKLQALRERLRAIKAQKEAQGSNTNGKSKKPVKAQRRQKHTDEEDEEDATDGDSSDSDGAPHARSSKHAPAVQSSKRAVTRRRSIVDVKKPVSRDPRFDNVAGPRPDENTVKKRYSFLDDYKASEMGELKAAIKKTKNEDDKEKLKRKLLSMESQKKAQDAKDKQQEIISQHKKKEKELVKQGKTPFFLKKCTYTAMLFQSTLPFTDYYCLAEQKKLALIDRFQNMKGKQRDHAIERRRKKVTAKERRNMPAERRVERF